MNMEVPVKSQVAAVAWSTKNISMMFSECCYPLHGATEIPGWIKAKAPYALSNTTKW